MVRRFWSSGRRRGGLRLAMAGLILVGVTAVSAAALPTSKAGAVTPATTWTEQSPATSPSARYGASMAYDPATGDVVLFGGEGSSAFLDDTWTWDGSTWTERSPATSPSARYGASMAYDPATGNMVLFGGVNSSGFLNDTWTWNGITWTKQSPGTSPPARFVATMADDPATGNMVLFGGINGSTYLGDTWTWDGSTWTKQSPAASPPARDLASMAYDPATGDMVLFGGYSGSSVLDDTWTWSGTTWTKQSPATSPSARYAASMAYDPATGDMVLFGGNSTSVNLDDTWTWDGSTWTEQSPVASPSTRLFASMAYDPATGDMVLFGGAGAAGFGGDTWTYGTVQYAPTVSQTLSPSSPVLVGTPVTDTATLTGASPTAGGTVSYAVYSDPGCTDPVASLGSSVAVTDGVPGSSDPWTATAGNDWFETTYTGDSTDTGPVSSSCDPLTVDSPSIGLVKTASIASYSAPDTPVTYSYAVTNTGNAALSDVTVTDPMLGLTAVNCGGNSNVVASLGAGDLGHLYGRLHHLPDRRGRRLHHQHRHGRRHPAGRAQRVGQRLADHPGRPEPGHRVDQVRFRQRLCRRGHPHHLLLCGGQRRQRDPHLGVGHRPHGRPLGRHLPVSDPRPRRHRDVHGHVHHHPGRRGCRLDHQHRHGDGHPAAVRTRRHRHLDDHRPGRTGPGHRDREDGQRQELLGPRHRDHLLLQGDRHRQRDPPPGDRHRPHERAVGHHLPVQRLGPDRL